MKCHKCKNELGPDSPKAKFCPYCGTSLSDTAEQESSDGTFDTSAEALVFIYKKYGAEVLLGKKLSAYIMDYAPELSDKTVRLIKMISELGAADTLKKAINGSDDDRTEAVRKAVLKLTDNFITNEIAENIISEFSAALGWGIYNTAASGKSTPPEEVKKDELIITDDLQADFIRQTYRLAQHGNVMAQLEIGKRFFDGKGIESNRDEAVKWLSAAVSQGNAEAMYRLGECYASGDNYIEGMYIGHLNGIPDDGAEIERKEKEALKWFHLAAEQGNTAAKFRLAECYEYGHGTESDTQLAMIWCRRAAQDGYAKAQYHLAHCYYFGENIEENKQEAINWYTKAAEQGHCWSQYSLGDYYFRSYDGNQNINKAIKWYKLAAANYEDNSANTSAQYALGDVYSYGLYIKPDNDEAFKWYKMSADNGYFLGKQRMGEIYLNGELGVKKDFKEALKWYNAADEKLDTKYVISFAKSGDQYAQLELGKRYYYGNGAALDYNAAFTQFKKSADSGNIDAMYYLGLCYYYGNGVPQNVGNATSLIKTAAAYGQEEAKEMLG